MTHREPIVTEAIERAGGYSQLARFLGVSAEAVWKWKRIPPKRVLSVEAITGIPRERLRPDIYGAPRAHPRRPLIEAAA